MATDWAADVKKYAPNADDAIIKGIVTYCGIALRNRDSSLVSFSDPTELARVRNNFLKKKLGLTHADEVLDAAIAKVGAVMKADRTKNRVTVYYLLAESYKLLGLFEKKGTAKTAAKAKAPAKTAAKGVKAAAAGAAGVAALASLDGGAKAKAPVKKAAAPKAAAAKPAPAKKAAAPKATTAKVATLKAAPAAKAADTGKVAAAAAAVTAVGAAALSTAGNAATTAKDTAAKAGDAIADTAGAAVDTTVKAGAAVAGAAGAAMAGAAGLASGMAGKATGTVQGLVGSDDEGDEGGLGWLWWLIGLVLLTALAWWLFGRKPADASAAGSAQTEAVASEAAAATTGAPADLAVAPAEGSATIPTGAGVTAETRDGKPVVKVYFDTGKTDVAPAFGGAAGGLKAWLDGHAGSTLAVSGYNDPSGNAARNAELSKNRAKAVAAELVKAGIAETSVALVKPEASTDANVPKEAARRVEVTVAP